MSNVNPLLHQYELPPFTEIEPHHVIPAIDFILKKNRKLINDILTRHNDYTWDSLIVPLEQAEDELHKAWSPVCHLHAVTDSPQWRDAYYAVLPKITEYHNQINQDKRLYDAYKTIANNDYFHTLDIAQQTVIQHALRDLKLSGIELAKVQQQQYQQLTNDLSKLTSDYSDNVLDATQAWTKHIIDELELSGLPEHVIIAAAKKAKDKNMQGWLLGLDFPCYSSVMMYADNRQLREQMYHAYVTRASDQGIVEYDNSKLMQSILEKRYQLATLLGFEHYTAYSLVPNMATSVDEVRQFLHQLLNKVKPIAKQSLNSLRKFAKSFDNTEELTSWDISYYSEKQRQQQYHISQEVLREYFPLDKVLTGLFSIIKKLYGMSVYSESVTAWDPQVTLFRIVDHKQQLRGKLYMDLFARENKRGGAWMDECQLRRETADGIQHPVAYLVCNFASPGQDKPALLTHEDVETLFHEFGHCLHHVLTQIDYSDVSGINGVPWDAVELPSQFMENWAWQQQSLLLFAEHYRTKTPLPDKLFNNLLSARNFQSGLQLLRQIEFALFDLELHTQPAGPDVAQHTLTQVRKQVAIMPVPAYNRFAHAFTHIFSGGYAAGYYSYAWADVLAADAFDEFLKYGLFNHKIGDKFLHCILEKGGSRPPMELFFDFCGRQPSVDALLKARGIN